MKALFESDSFKICFVIGLIAGFLAIAYPRPHGQARIWFKVRISDTALPLPASAESAYVSTPLEILDDGPTWLTVRLPTGEELRINQDLVAGLIDDSKRTPTAAPDTDRPRTPGPRIR